MVLLLPADTPAEDITAVMYDVFDFIQVPLLQPCTSETASACVAAKRELAGSDAFYAMLHGHFSCTEQGTWLTQAVGRGPRSVARVSCC